MRPNDIRPGKIFADTTGASRYIVQVDPANGRKGARVIWRRPGAFATKLHTETLTKFFDSIVKEDFDTKVDRAPHLENDGMAQPS